MLAGRPVPRGRPRRSLDEALCPTFWAASCSRRRPSPYATWLAGLALQGAQRWPRECARCYTHEGRSDGVSKTEVRDTQPRPWPAASVSMCPPRSTSSESANVVESVGVDELRERTRQQRRAADGRSEQTLQADIGNHSSASEPTVASSRCTSLDGGLSNLKQLLDPLTHRNHLWW